MWRPEAIDLDVEAADELLGFTRSALLWITVAPGELEAVEYEAAAPGSDAALRSARPARASVHFAAMARPPKTPVTPPSGKNLPAPQAILEREEPRRRPAAFAALGSGLATVLAVALEQVIAGKLPSTRVATDFIEALSAQSGGPATGTSYAVGYANFKLDHEAISVLIALLHGLSYLLLVPIVLLLLRGARERGGSLAKFLEPLAVVGLVLAGVGTIALGIMEVAEFRSVATPLTAGAIKDAITGGGRVAVTNVLSVATLAVALPMALGCIQAMRIGLLPRIAGLVGVVVGLLFLFQVSGGPLVIAIFFMYVAFLIRGRFDPSGRPFGRGTPGLPVAWATGTAVIPEPRQPPPPRAPKGGKGGEPKKPKLTK